MINPKAKYEDKALRNEPQTSSTAMCLSEKKLEF